MEVEENIEVEGNFKDPPHQIEKTHEETSDQNLQLQWKNEETMQDKHPMHGEDPMQEGTSSEEGPLAWFFEYFGKLNITMGRMEQRQEE